MTCTDRFSGVASWGRPEIPRLGKFAIVLLFASKAADFATTLVGLVFVRRIVEANPIARQVLAVAGIPGLFVISVLGVSLVVCAVELALSMSTLEDRLAGHGRLFLYAGSYFPLTMLYLAVTVHNLRLISTMI